MPLCCAPGQWLPQQFAATHEHISVQDEVPGERIPFPLLTQEGGPRPRGRGGRSHSSDDAAESQMTRGSVDRLCHARGGTITPAVVRGAEIGSALHDFARDFDGGCSRVEAFVAITAFGIEARTAGSTGVTVFLIPVRSPFPDIPR